MTVLPDPPPATDVTPPRPTAPAGPSRRSRLARATPFVTGAVIMLAIVLAFDAFEPKAEPLTRQDVSQVIASALASQVPGPPTSELVYDAIRPSIVLIETDAVDAAGEAVPGEGTGVLVNDAGDVLTALHVVAGATAIHLTFSDGSRSTGTITSQDAATDIAVVTPDAPPTGLAPATLGNPGSLRVGSEAYIVGNPFGLYGSLSAGVVSGLERSFQDPATKVVRQGLIQVDAAVNPGNSGGPLLDRGGRVVGIVTALINPTDQRVFIGIGLAVPIDVAGGGAGLPPY